MRACGFQPGRHRRDIVELPDLPEGANGQLVARQGQAHGGLEVAEVGVQLALVIANHQHLLRLVGGDEQRGPQLLKQAWEV